MFPTATEKLLKPYTEACMKPYGYLFIDLKQTTLEKDRIVKNLFPVTISGDECIDTTNTIMNPTLFEAKRQRLDTECSVCAQFEAKRQRLDTECSVSAQFEAKRQGLDTSCPVCGLMFDTIAHRDNHLETCKKPLLNDNSAFEDIFKEVEGRDNTDDVVKEMKRLYRNSLLRFHALNKSQKHRDMYEEFQSLLQHYSPEMAAKQVLKRNKTFFENLVDEESEDSDEGL